MPKFECYYQSDEQTFFSSYECESHRDAYSLFLSENGELDYNVLVRKTGLLNNEEEIFNDHREKVITEKRIELVNESCSLLDREKNNGYFKLETSQKINLQKIFDDIVLSAGNRPLLSKEIEFVEKWINFKHRELGQTLLAQAEANKPKSEQGSSPLGKLALAGMAMSTMRLSHDISAVSDQVENISEGMGFEG